MSVKHCVYLEDVPKTTSSGAVYLILVSSYILKVNQKSIFIHYFNPLGLISVVLTNTIKNVPIALVLRAS